MNKKIKLLVGIGITFSELIICFLFLYSILRPLRWSILLKKQDNAIYMNYKNSTKWKKYESNPVLGTRETGTLFDPFVLKYNTNDGEGYRLYVSNRSKGSIDCSESIDGISFGELETCLESCTESGWENQINRASILKTESKYLMYYTGQTNNISRIGYAESFDGIHFYRIQKDCILSPSENWEGDSVMNPCVLYDTNEKIYKMWYSAGETYEPDVMCYATSVDGINWDKFEYNPVFVKGQERYDSCKISCGQVIKNDDVYELYYIGYKNVDTASICLATSSDGINWKRDINNPILMSDKKGFDSDSVYKPTVVYEEFGAKIYYNGRSGANEYIGMAYKDLIIN